MNDAPLEIFTFEQGTKEWFASRLGIPTASMFHAVLAQGKKGTDAKTRRTYMLKLVGEILTGLPMENFNNKHMERGKLLEVEARNKYALANDVWPDPVGFMRRGRVGCSPDSLINDDGMIEVKTKLPHLQLEVLQQQEVPAEHIAQCQGQMWVAGREWVDFISYWPDLPLLTVRLPRDEEYIEKLKAAVDAFLAEMDEMVAKMIAMGAEKREPRMPDIADKFEDVEDT